MGPGASPHSMGDDVRFWRAEKVALKPGGLVSRQPRAPMPSARRLRCNGLVTVHADQHFLEHQPVFRLVPARPSSAPGARWPGADDDDASRGYHRHTMALARMSAQIIENQIFRRPNSTPSGCTFTRAPSSSAPVRGHGGAPGGRFLAANRGARCFRWAWTALRWSSRRCARCSAFRWGADRPLPPLQPRAAVAVVAHRLDGLAPKADIQGMCCGRWRSGPRPANQPV